MRTAESRAKTAAALKAWCASNPDKVRERAAKNSGANNYRWNGGSSRLNTAIRRLTEHRRWMDAVVRRDGKCSTCGTDADLEAHHVKPLAEIVSENGVATCEQARQCAALWNLSNGVTLCERCHCERHGRKYTPTGNGRRKQPRKVRRSMSGTANPNYRGGSVPLTCRCGAVFHVKKAQVSKRKHCSRRCLNANRRKTA